MHNYRSPTPPTRLERARPTHRRRHRDLHLRWMPAYLLTVTDPVSNTTTYSYDADNQARSPETSPTSGVTTYTYDLVGNVMRPWGIPTATRSPTATTPTTTLQPKPG